MKAGIFYRSMAYAGYQFNVGYELEEGYAGDAECPGYDPIVTVFSIAINGSEHDALDFIDPRTVQQIESIIFDSLE